MSELLFQILKMKAEDNPTTYTAKRVEVLRLQKVDSF